MKNGTKTYSSLDLDWLESHPNEKANKIGERVPYHLQYLREGGADIKPEEVEDAQKDKNSSAVSEN